MNGSIKGWIVKSHLVVFAAMDDALLFRSVGARRMTEVRIVSFTV
jgi:hypothetical protein